MEILPSVIRIIIDNYSQGMVYEVIYVKDMQTYGHTHILYPHASYIFSNMENALKKCTEFISKCTQTDIELEQLSNYLEDFGYSQFENRIWFIGSWADVDAFRQNQSGILLRMRIIDKVMEANESFITQSDVVHCFPCNMAVSSFINILPKRIMLILQKMQQFIHYENDDFNEMLEETTM